MNPHKNPTKTIETVLADCQKKLKPVSSAFNLEALILVGFVLKKNKEWLYAHPEKIISKNQARKIKNLVQKRKARTPLAYLTKTKEFYGHQFKVSPQALIPRPETEALVDLVIKTTQQSLSKKETPLIIDLGTGTGCVIISLAKKFNQIKKIDFLALDISPKALSLAKENARLLKTNTIIRFKKSDLLTIVLNRNSWLPKKRVIIVANLPYLSYTQYQKTEPEVKQEPAGALFTKEKGFFLIRKTIAQIKKIAKKNPDLILEVFFETDPALKPSINKACAKLFLDWSQEWFKDLSGKDRFFVLRNR